MEHVAAILMLVGCGYGNVDCRELPASRVGYETAEECQSDLKPVVAGVHSAAPVIYAKCAAVDPALFIEDSENARVLWTVTPQDELRVSIKVEEPEVPLMIATAEH
ncbi:hypothetical protein QO002_001385 [Pararhizobium capsulatum DSM 1112]|uniref:Lipoprotein n=1 Tax=Pararhizobium capsulatum DSM 1112 TaxID=1121113 RepID=A0ABU0BMR5_9HYPH|nr:hypothetical protein [Pararhizobium capsulatum]MDQ0319247.1 hypothetical protein [Pararhizobium capsulatum DSM 1112]